MQYVPCVGTIKKYCIVIGFMKEEEQGMILRQQGKKDAPLQNSFPSPNQLEEIATTNVILAQRFLLNISKTSS